MAASATIALYTGLNVLIIFALVWQVIAHRRREKITLGDGGFPPLIRAIRTHANATEVAPIALIGLIAMAMANAPLWAIHAGGLSLTLGRALHAYGLSRVEGASFGRMVGMVLSLVALLWIGIVCIWVAF
ncbi:MAPEG family protein [Aquidulcibacter sp.]|uniref:MAPEG family protein n=1 Tax=Aquidulcibacter sp. TaxID=2052990 RepID=UPI0025C26896|nr:MAPEG family protein [Aquidulcibacter sp.]MCA3696608.1 MAPEG family protein [Aquidulcibacter sp.]